MYLSEIFSSFRQAFGGTVLLIIQVAFTFAVLVNVYAMVDAYTVQLIGESGYVDEPSLIGITLRPYNSANRSDESTGQWRNQIERDLAIMRSTPGVKEVALAHQGIPFMNPLGPSNFDDIRRVDQDKTSSVPNTRYSADVNTLSMLGVELIAGRDFAESDVRWVSAIDIDGGPSTIITKTLADVLFPDQDAVGQLDRKSVV